MNLYVILKMVPDIVEELEIGDDGKSLDGEYLRRIPSEPCDHALEQALLLKERHGGTVTALALETEDLDDVLFNAIAKGADRVLKLCHEPNGHTGMEQAKMIAAALVDAGMQQDQDTMILTGSYAVDDLQGEIGPFLAAGLQMPYLGVVTSVAPQNDGRMLAIKEFSGGTRGEYEVKLPAVLGIQAAEIPPRYVPVAKIRAAMKAGGIEEVPAADLKPGAPAVVVTRMFKPEETDRAEILEGTPEEVSGRFAAILREQGML